MQVANTNFNAVKSNADFFNSPNVPYFSLALRIVSILYPDQNVD